MVVRLKVAWKLEEVKELYESAVREAKAAFGRGECFVEQYLDKPRHVEAQVIADQHGNIVVLVHVIARCNAVTRS